jgi:serine phosphatase RsbU (regulator of sigma subunit)
VDLENNLMRYAGAGHPPMLQWRNSTGKTTQVLENGLVLGIIEEPSYEALEFLLEPGDRYVLCTDGILEAANAAREEFGADRLMRFIENHKDLAAEPFSQTLLDDLAGWFNQTVDQGQQDDITLLVIDYKHH